MSGAMMLNSAAAERRTLEFAIRSTVNDPRPNSLMTLTGADLALARRELDRDDSVYRVTAPSAEAQVCEWLARLEIGMPFRTPEHERPGVAQAVLTACHHIPAVAFNENTLGQALRELQRVSSSGVYKIVEPVARSLRTRRSALKRLIEKADTFLTMPPVEQMNALEHADEVTKVGCMLRENLVQHGPRTNEVIGKPIHLSLEQRLRQAKETAASGDEPFAKIAQYQIAHLERQIVER